MARKQRVPLQQRAPPAPDFTDAVKKPDVGDIERTMANFLADLNKKSDFDVVSTPLSTMSLSKNAMDENSAAAAAPPTPPITPIPAPEAPKKAFDMSKLNKINQLFASKKQEAAAAATSTPTPKTADLNDKLKNLFQKNGLTSSGSTASVVTTTTTTATTTSSSLTPIAGANISKGLSSISSAGPAKAAEASGTLSKIEEYDPARPNDYDQLKRTQHKLAQEQEKLKNEKSLQEETAQMEIEKDNEYEEEEDYDAPACFGGGGSAGLGLNPLRPLSSIFANDTNAAAAAAAPSAKDTGDLYSKSNYESSEEKAFKLMSKQGFKLGQGLGKMSQGIVAPIIAQKISDTSAIITQSSMDLSTILPQEMIIKRYFEQRNLVPTKVICLINLVGPAEIDDELEEEITEECFAFGNVVDLKIYVMAAEDCEDAVRIFVKYEILNEAMDAFTNLDGRIFNGRSVIGYFYNEQNFESNQLANKLS